MPHKVLQLAKLTRPRLHGTVARERLFARLDEERERRAAICIVGPPGAGKTALTASWLDSRRVRGIWYQVDSSDADLGTFFYYLREGSSIFAGRGQRPLPLLTPEYLPDVPAFSRRFFRELFLRLPQGASLVLDNYQEVAADQLLHRLVADAAVEAPQGTTLVLISRRHPPDCYARLRANERVALVTWPELKLSLDEAVAIAKARGVLGRDRVQAIYSRADGWAAGMMLLLEQAKSGQDDTSDTSAVGKATFGYFASQIFDQLIERDRKILLRAALFPTVTVQLARDISGEAAAGEVLEYLYRQQMFTDRRAGDPAQYHFHALFRAFLLEKLAEAESAQAYSRLTQRAGELLEAQGRLEDAVALYREASEPDSAARLTLKLAPQLLSQGRWRTLQDWVRALPEERVDRDPWLLYWLGMAHMQKPRFDSARESLSRAFELHGASNDAVGQLLAAAGILRAYHLEFNNFCPMDPWIDRVNELMQVVPSFPSPETELDVYSALLAAFLRRRPGHPRLQEVVEHVRTLLETDIDANVRIGAAAPLIVFYASVPDLGQAQAIVQCMEPILRSPELTALNCAFWWVYVGLHYFRRGEREEADNALDEADRVSIEHGVGAPQFLSRIYRAYNYAILWSDLEGALSTLRGLEQFLSPSRPMNAAQYHHAFYRVALLRGDAQEAARHALLALEAVSTLGGAFFSIYWKIAAATGLAMLGEREQCERFLAEAWDDSGDTLLASYRINILLVRAYSALKGSRREEARTYIREMLALGRLNDSWRLLQTELHLREVVLEEALAAGIESELVKTIIRAFGLRPRRPDMDGWPWRVKVYTLGRFEVLVDDKPLEVSRKSPRRPLSLLKAVVALGSVNVPASKLIDALWADEDGDAAVRDFNVALYRLRKLLANPKALLVEDGCVSLNASHCWVDVLAIERRFDELDWALKQDDDLQMSGCLDTIRGLYPGSFLPADTEADWSVSLRERLRGRVVSAIQRAARRFEAAGRWDEALDWYGQGLDADDLAEAFYQGLMRCHLQMGQRAEGLTAYRRLRECLAAGLGIAPNPSSETLRRQLEAR